MLPIEMALPVHDEFTLHEFFRGVSIVNFDESRRSLNENIAIGEGSENSDAVGAGIPMP